MSGKSSNKSEVNVSGKSNQTGDIYSIAGSNNSVVKGDPAQSPKTIASDYIGSHYVKPENRVSKEVFIVHGHDELTKEKVARFLTEIGLVPIILFEKTSGGLTLIEKLEQHSNVSSAIVLLTPDDIGAAKRKPKDLKPRARQNVIFELGFFIGKLGRDKVLPFYTEKIEQPSDYRGVVYNQIDRGEGWKLIMARELAQLNLPVDMNIIL